MASVKKVLPVGNNEFHSLVEKANYDRTIVLKWGCLTRLDLETKICDYNDYSGSYSWSNILYWINYTSLCNDVQHTS